MIQMRQTAVKTMVVILGHGKNWSSNHKKVQLSQGKLSSVVNSQCINKIILYIVK